MAAHHYLEFVVIHTYPATKHVGYDLINANKV